MKQYKVTEYRPAMAIWEYVVEAETEDEAISMVENNTNVEPSDFEFIIEDNDEELPSHYEVTELKLN